VIGKTWRPKQGYTTRSTNFHAIGNRMEILRVLRPAICSDLVKDLRLEDKDLWSEDMDL